MRMFIGVKFSKDNHDRLITIQDSINTKGRKISCDNIHMTLVFLGELDKAQQTQAKQIIENINYHRFSISGFRIEMLRDIVVLKIKNNPDLQGLYDLLINELQEFKIDKRPYYPHITLIRNAHEKTNQEIDFHENIDKIILFSSQHVNGKLTYICEAQCLLT